MSEPAVAGRAWTCRDCAQDFVTPHWTGPIPTLCADCRTTSTNQRRLTGRPAKRIDETSAGYLLAREVSELRAAVILASAALDAGAVAEARAALEAVTGLPMRGDGMSTARLRNRVPKPRDAP